MKNIQAAFETMFAEQTWESLIALVNTFLKEIFGWVAKEEGWDA